MNRAAEPDDAGTGTELSARLDARLRASGDPRATRGGEAFDAYPDTGGSPLHPGFDPDRAGPPEG